MCWSVLGADLEKFPSCMRDQLRQALPKRFYTQVAVHRCGVGEQTDAFAILLDGKPVRTPRKSVLAVPTEALAEAIAAEWRAQRELIDPETMPLTRVVNSALDGVKGRQEEVRREILGYAASDLTCYLAPGPRELAERQAREWGAIHVWAQDALGARFACVAGIVPIAQPSATLAAVQRTLEAYGTFELTALHVMTTLTGSALLALALARAQGALSAERAWALAHLDEDWQIAQWGDDAEAAARRARRWLEMKAASDLLTLLSPPRGT